MLCNVSHLLRGVEGQGLLLFSYHKRDNFGNTVHSVLKILNFFSPGNFKERSAPRILATFFFFF